MSLYKIKKYIFTQIMQLVRISVAKRRFVSRFLVLRAPLLQADPIIAKLLGSMGWRFLRACSLIAEEGLELWLRALPVLSLTPRCSAIRFAMLHVVIPTHAAEQRHV